MSAPYSEDTLQVEGLRGGGYDDELRDALITHCRLPSDAVARITETMNAMDGSFVEAALHIGLVTEREAAEAEAWVRATTERRDAGVVETALRRQGTHPLIVRHVGTGRPSERLVLAHDAEHPHSERIRMLRAELLLLNETDRQASCLAMLSPRAGEGRSQVAAELAIAFSQLSRRTLLVDADLRNPTQHLLFGIRSDWGLAQSLAFGQPSQLFGVDGLPFLSVLPSGPAPRNPSELLSGGRIKHLLNRWRYGYDFIVIDTPPTSKYSDALSIASMAGSVVLVSRAQSTPYRDIKEALRRLGLTQSRILGAVISNF
jgi:capsular exopolysaccharide synthesis family protein